MSGVELVFRSVGEQTRDLALELAERSLKPDRVHAIEDVRPFSAAVEAMLELDLAAEHVVAVDADCLILEELRPFVEACEDPYVGCVVEDRFRGSIHAGVHVTRIEVIRTMRTLRPDPDSERFLLRPESTWRKLALERIGARRVSRSSRILHDHFQSYPHVFQKYAQRELRSRAKARQADALEAAMHRWGDEPDFRVARAAVARARREVGEDASADSVRRFLDALPAAAEEAVAAMRLPPPVPPDLPSVLERAAQLGWAS